MAPTPNAPAPSARPAAICKSFLLLFFKKEVLPVFLLAGCATPQPTPPNPRIPPFAASGWAPFSRAAETQIALREWRLFGSQIDDDPPDSRPAPAAKPERAEGLWQRIGEYWWEGMPPGTPEASATGIHDPSGQEVADDTNTPWSAAFVSYVFRIAGAGDRFPYSASHSTYINAAASGTHPMLHAWPPSAYAPAPGDLVCHGRGAAAALRFADLPTGGGFTSHCDIVVGVAPGSLAVVGGNVDDAVTLRHVPIDAGGYITAPCLAVIQVIGANRSS